MTILPSKLLLLNISYLPWVPNRKKRNEAIFFYLLKDTELFSHGLFINPVNMSDETAEYEVYQGTAGKTQFVVNQTSTPESSTRSRSKLEDAANDYIEVLRRKYIKDDQYLLWINSAETFEYLLARQLLPKARATVVDLSDDFTTFDRDNQTQFRIQLNHLVNASDGLLCVNKHVQDKFHHKQSFVLNNGTDFDGFKKIDVNFTMPPLFPKIPNKKYIGYSGGILKGRMDMDILDRLFTRFPECIFIFVGYYNDRRLIDHIIQHDNAHYIPEIPYTQLQNVISRFDVAIIPHLVNEGTAGNDLLKVYEYLACGVPVVSTDCSDVRRFQELINISTDAESFSNNVGLVINDKHSFDIVAARNYSRLCTWKNRTQLLHKWLQEKIISSHLL